MALSRLSRLEDRKQRKRLVLSLAGIIGVVVFLAIFGLKILVGFSVLVDTLRGNSPPLPQTQTAILLPPDIDSLPAATPSATMTVSGHGQPDMTLILYLNDKEAKKLTVSKDGTFFINDLALQDGDNAISAKLMDDKGNISELSQVLHVVSKRSGPLLEVTTPDDGARVMGESNNTVTISGHTEEDATITINGRFVLLSDTGSFTYKVNLNEGDNTFTIVATDQAGNKTTAQRRVSYSK